MRVVLSTRFVYDRITRGVYGRRMKPLPLHVALKAARTAAGMTQGQVTEACGWDSTSRYPNYEQGTREPTLADLRTIAKAVAHGGHTFARIVTGEDVVPASQLGRLDPAIILRTVELTRNALAKLKKPYAGPEKDPELFAEMLRLAILEKAESGNGERGVWSAGGSGRGVAGAAGEEKDGATARSEVGRGRKRVRAG